MVMVRVMVVVVVRVMVRVMVRVRGSGTFEWRAASGRSPSSEPSSLPSFPLCIDCLTGCSGRGALSTPEAGSSQGGISTVAALRPPETERDWRSAHVRVCFSENVFKVPWDWEEVEYTLAPAAPTPTPDPNPPPPPPPPNPPCPSSITSSLSGLNSEYRRKPSLSNSCSHRDSGIVPVPVFKRGSSGSVSWVYDFGSNLYNLYSGKFGISPAC